MFFIIIIYWYMMNITSQPSPVGLFHLLRAYLSGEKEAREELESFLFTSNNFWDIVFLDLAQCFQEKSFSQLILLLISRRLRNCGCDELTGNVLINHLLPFVNEEVNRLLISTVLANVLVHSPLDVAIVVYHILEVAQAATLFCLSFLAEVALAVDEINTSSDKIDNIEYMKQKRKSLCMLHVNVLSYCYQVLAEPSSSEPLRIESVACITAWLTAELLPSHSIENIVYLAPAAVSPSDGTIANNSVPILEAFIILTLVSSGGKCSIEESEAFLSVVVDLLETLFVQCFEGRRHPESPRGGIDPKMRMSEAAVNRFTTTLINVAGNVAPLFRQFLLTCPDSCFGGLFLPDRYSFATTSGCFLDISNAAVSTAATTVAIRSMTRLLTVSAKFLMASSINPFALLGAHDQPTDSSGTFDDVNVTEDLVIELLTSLVTAGGLRDTSIASIALEGCVYVHHRTPPSIRRKQQGWYCLLMQVSMRHCCSVYSRQESHDEDDDAITDEISECEEWKLMRRDVVSEVVCIVYQELRGEFLGFATDIMKTYLHLLQNSTDISFHTVVSVVAGVLYSLYMCSHDLVKRSLMALENSNGTSDVDVLTDAVETTQYLVEFLGNVFDNSVFTVTPLLSSLSDAANRSTLQLLFSQTTVVVAVNQFLGALSHWFSVGRCLSRQTLGGNGHCCTQLSSRLQPTLAVDVFGELGEDCLKYLMTGYSSPCTMLSSANALYKFCELNSTNILNYRELYKAEEEKNKGESGKGDECLTKFPVLDSLLQHCLVPTVSLAVAVHNPYSNTSTKESAMSRHEVLGHLEASLEHDLFHVSLNEKEAEVNLWTGDAVRYCIQQSTLRAMCLVLVQIAPGVDLSSTSTGVSITRRHYEDELLRPLRNALAVLSSTCSDVSFDSSTTLHAACASDMVGILGLMTTLISNGVAVELIIDLLSDENQELQRLCEHFYSSSLFQTNKVSNAVCILCTSVMTAVASSPAHCFELASALFFNYARYSILAGMYVERVLEGGLGARGAHIQRLKQKMGSTFGEVYNEEQIFEVEMLVVLLVCEVFSPYLELLTNLTTLVHAACSPSTLPYSQSSYDIFFPIREHILVLLQASPLPHHYLRQNQPLLHTCNNTPFSTSVLQLLRIFHRVCALTPSLLHHLPPTIRLGCIQLAILCISFFSVEPSISALATSVISQVFVMKSKIKTSQKGLIVLAWERCILELMDGAQEKGACVQQPYEQREGVLIGVLARLLFNCSPEGEEKEMCQQTNLLVAYVSLLHQVLKDYSLYPLATSSNNLNTDSGVEMGIDINRTIKNVISLTKQIDCKLESPFSRQDMSHILGVFIHLCRDSNNLTNSYSFAHFGSLVTQIVSKKASISSLSEYNRFITVSTF